MLTEKAGSLCTWVRADPGSAGLGYTGGWVCREAWSAMCSTRSGATFPMPTVQNHLTGRRIPGWRREALRATLWLVPTVMVVGVCALFVVTYSVDRAAADGLLKLPSWIDTDGADAARQVLIGIAAAVITVAGVVFSITILALTLASQQFGPRMLRNFIRDRGIQFTLGVFVSTFVYSLLTL